MSSTLFQKDFVLLWQGQLVSAIGTQLFNVALMYWLLRTTGSATTMGFVLTASLLPVAVLSIFTGVLVDRLPRKFLIVGADVVRGLLCLSFVAAMELADISGAISLLFVYAFVAGIASTLFGPALRAALPEVVGRINLQRANGLLQGASSFAGTVGAGFGGFLYVILGPRALFLANGVSFLLSALSESFVTIPDHEGRPHANLFSEVREGLSFMYRDHGLRRILVTVALMNVTSAPMTITLPMFVRDRHGSGPELLGLVAASQSIGRLTAAAMIGSRKLSTSVRPGVCPLSLLVCAMSLVAMVYLDSEVLLLLAFGLYGMGIVWFNVPIQSAIQLRTPSALRGRVISASTTLVGCIVPVSAAITGIVVDLVDKNVPLIWGATAGVFVACALSLATSRRARRYLDVARV